MSNGNNRFKAVLFDLDGTLSDSAPGIVSSLKHAFTRLDMRVPADSELQAHIGSSLKSIFVDAYGVAATRLDEAIRLYREYYLPKGMFENTLFPGIADMLRTLHERGLLLAVATAKPEPYADQIVGFLGVRDCFFTIAGSTVEETRIAKAEIIALALERGKLKPEECLMVGDRHHDMDGARANGMQSAAVLWGYGPEAELRKAGADYYVRTPKELAGLC